MEPSDCHSADEGSQSPIWIGRARSRYSSPMRGAADKAPPRVIGNKTKVHAVGQQRHTSREAHGSTGRPNVLPAERKVNATLSEAFGSWLNRHGATFAVCIRAVNVIESILSHVDLRDSTSEREELRGLIMAKQKELQQSADPFQLTTLALLSHYLNEATDKLVLGSLIAVLEQQVNGTNVGVRGQADEGAWRKDMEEDTDAEQSVGMENGPTDGGRETKGASPKKKASASAVSTSGRRGGAVGGKGRKKTLCDWLVDVTRDLLPDENENTVRRHSSYNRRFMWPQNDFPTEGDVTTIIDLLKTSQESLLRRFKNDSNSHCFRHLVTALVKRGLLAKADWEALCYEEKLSGVMKGKKLWGKPVAKGRKPKATAPAPPVQSCPDSDTDVEGGDTLMSSHLRGEGPRVEPVPKKLWVLRLEPEAMDWCVARIMDGGMSEQDARQAISWVLSKLRPLLPEPSSVEVCWGRQDLISRVTEHHMKLSEVSKGRDGRKAMQAVQVLQEQYAVESSLRQEADHQGATKPRASPRKPPRAGPISQPTKKRPLPSSSSSRSSSSSSSSSPARPALPSPMSRQSSSPSSSDTDSDSPPKKRPHDSPRSPVSGSSSSTGSASVGGPSAMRVEDDAPSAPADGLVLTPSLVEELWDCLRDTRGGEATVKLILSKVESTLACLSCPKDQPVKTKDALRRVLTREAAAFRRLRVDRGYWIRFLLEVGMGDLQGPLGLSAGADDDDDSDDSEDEETLPPSITPAPASPAREKETTGLKRGRGRPPKVGGAAAKEEGKGVQMLIKSVQIKKLKAEKGEEKIVLVILPGLYTDTLKSQGISEADVRKVVEAIAVSSKRDVPYVHLEELYKDIKTNMKDEASKGVFKRLKDRGLKAALSAVKDTVRSHHIEAKISDGKLEAWGPVFAMTANMRGQMETWARKKHYSTAELSRFAGTVLTSETLGLTGRREVLDWGRVQALVGEDSKTGAAVTAKAKQLMLSQELKKLRTFLSEQA